MFGRTAEELEKIMRVAQIVQVPVITNMMLSETAVKRLFHKLFTQRVAIDAQLAKHVGCTFVELTNFLRSRFGTIVILNEIRLYNLLALLNEIPIKKSILAKVSSRPHLGNGRR